MTAPEAEGLPQPRRGLAIAAVLTAMCLVVLDAGMANVALPTLARALHAPPARTILVVTAYQTALVMALLPSAALGERFGYRRVFVWGVAIFTAASALCALSPSLPWLVTARFLQGLGGAAIMALGIALLRFAVPQGRLGAAIGWNALTVALASAASPTLGALILAGPGWPWLFLVNLPLGALALLAARALPAIAGTAQRLDRLSLALNGLAFAALVVGAELLPSAPLAAALWLGAAGLALTALVRRETPKVAPMIPLDLLRDRAFRISVIASVCCFAGQTAGLVALPFYLQHGLRQTPLMTGAYMTPWPLSVAAAALVAGRLADRAPTARLCALGGAGLALGLAATALWPLHGDPRPLIGFAIVSGLGFGLFQTPNNRNMFLSAPPERGAAAGGLQGAARLTGQTAGAVLMTVLFVTTSAEAAPRLGLGLGAALALAAGLVSTLRAPARA
jgi:DHA2 family multidrug resistance protein-like MFS transporter